MKKVTALLLLTLSTPLISYTAIAKELKKPSAIDKNYIDFQIYGMTIAEGDSLDQSSSTSKYKNIAYTFTNVDLDFNFNKNISLITQTSVQNRKNGFARPYALIDYTNGNNDIGLLFDNTGVTSRVLALNLHNKNTSLIIGKIRPRAGVANGTNSEIIKEDWYGVYGAMLNGGYANTNKIGMQFNTSFAIVPYSRQHLEIAAFKNDTTALNDPALSSIGTFGYSMPRSVQGIISTREAGNTFAPSSFSILAINESELIDKQNISYSIYYRKQDINKQNGSFLAPENTIAASAQYEKSYEDAKLGAFGNVAVVSNAFGISDLEEKYYTAAAYVDIDNFTIAFVYNLYTMNGLSNVGGNGKNIQAEQLSQTQISFGYRLSKALKVDVAYRQLTDGKTDKATQGVGLGLKYNIGTKDV